MKRLLLIFGLALLLVPAASAAQAPASIVLNASPTFLSTLSFTVVIDRGSAASVAVECFSPFDGSGDLLASTNRFAATPGIPTSTPSGPSDQQIVMTAARGSSCTAYLYRWVLKPNGSWQQMIATTLLFTSL